MIIKFTPEQYQNALKQAKHSEYLIDTATLTESICFPFIRTERYGLQIKIFLNSTKDKAVIEICFDGSNKFQAEFDTYQAIQIISNATCRYEDTFSHAIKEMFGA